MSNRCLRILFVSNNMPQYKNQHMLDAMLDSKVIDVRIVHLFNDNYKDSIFDKVFVKFKIPLDRNNVNKRILIEVLDFQPNVVFIVKGNHIYPKTLRHIKERMPNTKLVSWSLDDMYAWHNRSIFYTLGLKYYDVVFTSKSYNVAELEKIGAKHIHFLYQAYSKTKHLIDRFPSNYLPERDVLFIGYAEQERFESLKFLAKNGISVHVYGTGWDFACRGEECENLHIHSKDLLGEDYRNFIFGSKINLCFLRKINRDLHTSRSLEIPACGGFMVAERTQEHKDLFVEGLEAAYFDNNNELLDVVRYYLEHEDERSLIAENAWKKCQDKDYSYHNMLNSILRLV